jgi:nucleoporin NDC1
VLWSWFPLGPTGIRTVFFFFCTISIIILRIAQYHPGFRTSDSAAHTFFQYGLTLPTVEALFTYSTSAYLFSQIYLWSLPEGSGFEWITYFMSDRARLNEKPILLTTHLVLVGIFQALRHLYEDVDRLSLGVARPEAGTGKPMDGDASIQVQRFKDQLPGIVLSSVNQSILGFIITLFVYPLLLRATIWRTMMTFLRPIYKLPRTNMVPTTLPFSFTAILRCWFVSLMILLAWTTANTAFSLFLVKSPLKNGKPLTTDSKDPNGSLLNGLKNKKLSIKVLPVRAMLVSM